MTFSFLRIAMVLILLSSLNACSSGTQNVTASTANVENSSELDNSKEAKKIEEQLLGRWERGYKKTTQVIFFARDRQVTWWQTDQTKAKDFGKYSIDANASPLILNITVKDKKIPLGIIELTSNKTMRFERSRLSSLKEAYAPRKFDKGSLVFKKTSNSAKLPSNIQIETIK